MEKLEQVLQMVQLVVFLAAAVAAVAVWARHRTRPAVFLALTFGSLGLTLLVSRLSSSSSLVTDAEWVSDIVVVGLGAFPWLLALFAWSFERRFPKWLLASGLAVVAIGVWNLLLPDTPEGATSTSDRMFVAAFLLVWIVLAGVAGAKLWRSGGTQPLVRARMRLMAAGAATLTLALVLAAAGPAEASGVSVGANLLAIVAAMSFGAGFAPPRALRVWWRRITVADWQQMQGALISATTPHDAAAAVAPVVADLLGGGTAIVAADGEVLASARLRPEEAELAAGRLVAGDPPAAGDEVVPVESSWLVIRPTAYTPIFGQDERDLVAGFASQLRLALDRAALFVANQEARRDLERLRDDERAMVAGLVHDLRGASNTLGSYVGLLRSSQTDAEREQILTGIEGGSQHLERLVGALLDVARLDAAERTMAPVDLDEVVAETVGRLSVSHPHVVVDCDPLPSVEGVASELTQVFDNLLRNAAVHGGRDDLHVTISVHESAAGTGPINLLSDEPHATGSEGNTTGPTTPAGVVTIDVRDDGRGIDPEDRDAVFRLFKRGRTAARGGSGVGLNIVRRIVEAHGGTVEALENDPGAHFQIRLPITRMQTHAPREQTDHAVVNS